MLAKTRPLAPQLTQKEIVAMPKQDQLISTAQAADIIGVNDSRIRQYIKEGKLPAFKIGNRWVIRRIDAETFKRPSMGRPKDE